MKGRTANLALVATLAAVLAGCQSRPVVVEDRALVEPPRPLPAAEALVPCAKPSGLEDKSFGAVVRKLSEVLGLLDECSSKHKELKEFVSE